MYTELAKCELVHLSWRSVNFINLSSLFRFKVREEEGVCLPELANRPPLISDDREPISSVVCEKTFGMLDQGSDIEGGCSTFRASTGSRVHDPHCATGLRYCVATKTSRCH